MILKNQTEKVKTNVSAEPLQQSASVFLRTPLNQRICQLFF
jgi:hypothetical protein